MKKSVLVRAGVFLLAVAVLLQGCNKDNDQELRDKVMRQLQQYIEDNNITQEPTASGLYYILITEGTGTRPENNFYVDIDFTRELIDGTVLLTSHEDVARDNGLYDGSVIYGPIRLIAGNTGIPGLNEGLMFMREGGKATMIMPSDINGFGGQSASNSPPYSTHIYTVDLVNAFDDPVQFESDQITDYLDEHGIDSAYVTESGLYLIENNPGTGELVKDGDIVELWYTGTFLDGRVFDTNVGEQVMSVPMPAEAPTYIEAWDEALKLMREKGEAKIIVPYELAYGEYGQDKIPPYMTLVFDLEIEKVLTGK